MTLLAVAAAHALLASPDRSVSMVMMKRERIIIFPPPPPPKKNEAKQRMAEISTKKETLRLNKHILRNLGDDKRNATIGNKGKHVSDTT